MKKIMLISLCLLTMFCFSCADRNKVKPAETFINPQEPTSEISSSETDANETSSQTTAPAETESAKYSLNTELISNIGKSLADMTAEHGAIVESRWESGPVYVHGDGFQAGYTEYIINEDNSFTPTDDSFCHCFFAGLENLIVGSDKTAYTPDELTEIFGVKCEVGVDQVVSLSSISLVKDGVWFYALPDNTDNISSSTIVFVKKADN